MVEVRPNEDRTDQRIEVFSECMLLYFFYGILVAEVCDEPIQQFRFGWFAVTCFALLFLTQFFFILHCALHPYLRRLKFFLLRKCPCLHKLRRCPKLPKCKVCKKPQPLPEAPAKPKCSLKCACCTACLKSLQTLRIFRRKNQQVVEAGKTDQVKPGDLENAAKGGFGEEAKKAMERSPQGKGDQVERGQDQFEGHLGDERCPLTTAARRSSGAQATKTTS